MSFWVLEERRTEDDIRTGWRRRGRGICVKDGSYGNGDKRRQGVNGWSPAGGGRRGGGLQEGQESSPLTDRPSAAASCCLATPPLARPGRMRRSSEGGVPPGAPGTSGRCRDAARQPGTVNRKQSARRRGEPRSSPASTGPRPLKVLEVILTTVQIKGP